MSDTGDTRLGDAIAQVVRRVPDAFFLQIGGFDGESFDPLRAHVVAHNLRGLIVEPIPRYYEKLRALYAGSATVRTANVAVAEQDGQRTLYQFSPEAVERGLLLPHFAGISSFVMDDLLSDTGVLGRSSPNAETTAILRKLVQPVTVQCRTVDRLFREFGISRVDILQIDTEGYDFVVLKLFDFARYRPAIVHYEHQHLSPADAKAAAQLLAGHGYRLMHHQYDTLAVRETDQERLRVLLHRQWGEGRLLETMQTVAALQALVGPAAVAEDIRAIKFQAFKRYNAHREACEVAEAEQYAAGLAALLPGHLAILEAAFECNRILGRFTKAADYAIALLNVDTAHRAAVTFLAEMRKVPDMAQIEIDRRMALAWSARTGKDELYRLRDLHGAAGAILATPLNEQRSAQLRSILDLAAVTRPPFESGSEGERWDKYFRLKIEAIDLDVPLSDDADTPVTFCTAQGAPLDWQGVRATAERLGARAVFFAAADERYVARYAKWYAATILLRCDIPCLVVIHVIGAAANLPAIAAGVGVSNPRLIFAGDDFDAAAVTSRVVDAPSAKPATVPVTHYQSMRFLQLGAVLKHANLPVFVSDIDTVLQRGVGDLLETHSQADAVLNENIYALSLADRYTANLVLVYPTPNARRFARFLRTYLEKYLQKPEIIRWIDQLGLLMARHYLHRLGARLGTFDTEADINNMIYTTYVQNPYRFLSLYQDFNLESLAALAPAAPEEAQSLHPSGG